MKLKHSASIIPKCDRNTEREEWNRDEAGQADVMRAGNIRAVYSKLCLSTDAEVSSRERPDEKLTLKKIVGRNLITGGNHKGENLSWDFYLLFF